MQSPKKEVRPSGIAIKASELRIAGHLAQVNLGVKEMTKTYASRGWSIFRTWASCSHHVKELQPASPLLSVLSS